MSKLKTTLLKLLFAITMLMCFFVFLKSLVGIVQSYQNYLFFAIGGVVYFLLAKLAKKNISFFHTFTHEFAHMIVGLLFGKKIVSFYAGSSDGGVIKLNGKLNIFIILAPYCLPTLTYLFLLLPLITHLPDWYMGFVGLSLAFHLHAFKRQTRADQSDIQRNGVVLSMLFIFTFLMFNLAVTIYSVNFNLLIAFKMVFVDLYNLVVYTFSTLTDFLINRP